MAKRTLTRRQQTILQSLAVSNGETAKQLGVRSDVLWRLEEMGLVVRTIHERWLLTGRGVLMAQELLLAGGK